LACWYAPHTRGETRRVHVNQKKKDDGDEDEDEEDDEKVEEEVEEEEHKSYRNDWAAP
jgi:hypothetical protein